MVDGVCHVVPRGEDFAFYLFFTAHYTDSIIFQVFEIVCLNLIPQA